MFVGFNFYSMAWMYLCYQGQNLSNWNVHTNTWGILNADFSLIGLRWGLRFCIIGPNILTLALSISFAI